MIIDPTLESQEAMTAKTLVVPPAERTGGEVDTPYPAISNIPVIKAEYTGAAIEVPEYEPISITSDISATVDFSDNIDRLKLRTSENSNGQTPVYTRLKLEVKSPADGSENIFNLSGLATFTKGVSESGDTISYTAYAYGVALRINIYCIVNFGTITIQRVSFDRIVAPQLVTPLNRPVYLSCDANSITLPFSVGDTTSVELETKYLHIEGGTDIDKEIINYLNYALDNNIKSFPLNVNSFRYMVQGSVKVVSGDGIAVVTRITGTKNFKIRLVTPYEDKSNTTPMRGSYITEWIIEPYTTMMDTTSFRMVSASIQACVVAF